MIIHIFSQNSNHFYKPIKNTSPLSRTRKKFIFYLQYPHFFHTQISHLIFMIITVDTKHQSLINNHFHILNVGSNKQAFPKFQHDMDSYKSHVTLPYGRVPPKLITYFLFHIKPVSPSAGFPLFFNLYIR